MITTILVSVFVGAMGFALGYMFGTERYSPDEVTVRESALRVERANKQAGKLSKIIHRQRLMIRKLKVYAPKPEPKKAVNH